MNSVSRCPLVCIAALATYLVVHVFAGPLHHHGTKSVTARTPAADTANLQCQPTDSAENDEEESCVLCSVLHLAQILPTALHVEAVTTLNREAFFATALVRPHPLEATTYSRGPPLM